MPHNVVLLALLKILMSACYYKAEKKFNEMIFSVEYFPSG